MKRTIQWLLLILMTLIATPALAIIEGPLRPETPMSALHESSWRGRYKLIEAEVEAVAKKMPVQFKKLVASQIECLRAYIALVQSDFHLDWAAGTDLAKYESLTNRDLRDYYKKTCGGGGGGGSPGKKVYDDYLEKYGDTAREELVRFLSEGGKVQIFTTTQLPLPAQAVSPASQSSKWQTFKFLANVLFMSSSTGFTYQMVQLDWERYKKTGEISNSNKIILAGAGLTFLAAGGPAAGALILIY